MKFKLLLTALVVGALAFFAGAWWKGRTTGGPAGASKSGERKVAFYQSPMHPWIKSDKPGRCTICGMALAPVYEGERGFEAGEGVTTLGSNIVQVINLQTAPALRGPLQRTLRVAGTIDDNETRHRFVSAYVDGRIDQLAINFVGAEVVEGEPLATIYSPSLLTAEREYVALRGEGSATSSGSNFLQAAALRLKRMGLAESQIAALSDKAAGASQSAILAPTTGTVVQRMVYEGEYVKEGQKLFEIADFSVMWFVFDAYEQDLPWIQTGQTVHVRTPAVPGRTFEGKVVFIDPTLREMTRSARVRVELANPLVETNGVRRRLLYHRLYAEGTVEVNTPNVLLVPRSAVLAAGQVPKVYVEVSAGTYAMREVKLGRAGDQEWEILSGLEPGERVVTSGSMLVDAQAQLNQSAHGSAGHDHARGEMPEQHSPGNTETNAAPLSLSVPQTAALTNFLHVMDQLSGTLAADDLKAYNDQRALVKPAAVTMEKEFSSTPQGTLAKAVVEHAELKAAADLNAARKAFHNLAQPAVALAQASRGAPGLDSLKVYRCPMTKTAWPGAPRSALWLQWAGPLRNPWFGAEMLDCGVEVK